MPIVGVASVASGGAACKASLQCFGTEFGRQWAALRAHQTASVEKTTWTRPEVVLSRYTVLGYCRQRYIRGSLLVSYDASQLCPPRSGFALKTCAHKPYCTQTCSSTAVLSCLTRGNAGAVKLPCAVPQPQTPLPRGCQRRGSPRKQRRPKSYQRRIAAPKRSKQPCPPARARAASRR